MLKEKIIGICILIFMIAFCLNLTLPAHAEKDCKKITLTNPGDAEYCKMDPLEFDPDNDDKIACGTPLTLSVTGGKSPITWSVLEDSGYSLEQGEDERTYILSCTGDTCGEDYAAVATVTVTDSCGETPNEITAKIRNDDGTWENTGEHICTPPCESGPNGGCGSFGYNCTLGDKRYCYQFCPSPCSSNCPPEICSECGPNYYNIQQWSCPE